MSQGSWSMLKSWKAYVKVKIHELATRSTTSCWWYNSFFWIKRNFYNSNIVRKARQQKYENEHWRRRRRGIYEEDDEWTGQKLTWKKGVCCIEDLPETNPNVSSFCRWLLQAEWHHACLNPVKPAERKTSANLVWFSSHTHRHFFEVLLGMCDMMIR